MIEQRVRFIREYNKEVRGRKKTMSELCVEHGISRKTGYKMLNRHTEGGWPGLADHSRSPHGGRHWSSPEIVIRVLETRLEFPHWGAETIVAYLARQEPTVSWPQPSVAHEWIRRAGLVVLRGHARRFPHPGRPAQVELDRPNQQWSVDFKGHFRTRDRRYCYPLTVADSFSRYVIGCQSLLSTSFELVWPVFERLFRKNGLPEAILSDNGTPFSSNSVKRLSKLSVRWIRLGIEPRLIEPGKPQQNGRHERMHGHMKPLVCADPSENSVEQQRQFEWFLSHYNDIRPHKALHRHVPADLYVPSPRPYPKRLPTIEYPTHFDVRRVRTSGEIKWQGQWFFLSDALAGEDVAFELAAQDCWVIHFGPLELGYYSGREHKLHLDRPRPAKRTDND